MPEIISFHELLKTNGQCPWCDFRTEAVVELIDHIHAEHGEVTILPEED